MCRYLNDRAGGSLMPRDARSRAATDQWMSIEAANFSSHAMKFVYHYLLHMQHQPSDLENAGAALHKALGVLDPQLAKQPFVAGAMFSLADICFMPYFEYGLLTPAKDIMTKHPSVMTWWNKVRERPSWRKVAALA